MRSWLAFSMQHQQGNVRRQQHEKLSSPAKSTCGLNTVLCILLACQGPVVQMGIAASTPIKLKSILPSELSTPCRRRH